MINISRELNSDATSDKFCPPMHPYKLQIALSTKSTLLFIKKKEMFKSHEIKEKNNGIDYFFFSFRFS